MLDSVLHVNHREISEDDRKSLSEIIHEEMRANAEAAKALVTFRDKCIATIVTVLYLVYPYRVGQNWSTCVWPVTSKKILFMSYRLD